VILSQGDAEGGVFRHSIEVFGHALSNGLERLEAVGAVGCVDTDDLAGAVIDSDEDIGAAFIDGDGLGHIGSPDLVDAFGDDGALMRMSGPVLGPVGGHQAVVPHDTADATRGGSDAGLTQAGPDFAVALPLERGGFDLLLNSLEKVGVAGRALRSTATRHRGLVGRFGFGAGTMAMNGGPGDTPGAADGSHAIGTLAGGRDAEVANAQDPGRFTPACHGAVGAADYGIAVLPARPHKPKDKSKVEGGVLLVQRWIVARLRNRRFFSLEELNAAIAIELEGLNGRASRHLGASRRDLFETIERPAMRSLPPRGGVGRPPFISPEKPVPPESGCCAAASETLCRRRGQRVPPHGNLCAAGGTGPVRKCAAGRPRNDRFCPASAGCRRFGGSRQNARFSAPFGAGPSPRAPPPEGTNDKGWCRQDTRFVLQIAPITHQSGAPGGRRSDG